MIKILKKKNYCNDFLVSSNVDHYEMRHISCNNLVPPNVRYTFRWGDGDVLATQPGQTEDYAIYICVFVPPLNTHH